MNNWYLFGDENDIWLYTVAEMDVLDKGRAHGLPSTPRGVSKQVPFLIERKTPKTNNWYFSTKTIFGCIAEVDVVDKRRVHGFHVHLEG